MKRAIVGVVLGLLTLAGVPAGAQETIEHVVVFTLPGITWQATAEVDTPTLDRLAERSAVAGLATRTAVRRPNLERGYLTLGAGNRAFVGGTDPVSHLAFPADAPFEGGTAADALARRVEERPSGEIVHLGLPEIAQKQERYLYGTEVGALGEALSRAGIRRAVVSAADISLTPEPEEFRRASVLGIVDRSGTVDHGTLNGLLSAAPDAPFGVVTDPGRFEAAVQRALGRARVVLVDPGETLRAEEYTPLATADEARRHRREALVRTDRLLGRVADLLGPRDLLLVVASSPPLWLPDPRLTTTIVSGPGYGVGWVRTATTRHDGLATISDVAPTILAATGVEQPEAMNGTPMRFVPDADEGRVDALIALDEASTFRENFAVDVFYALAGGLFSVLAVLAYIVFLGRSRRLLPWLIGVAYLILAVPTAAHVIRALEVYRLGLPLAHLALWSTAVALAALAFFVPGPRWTGGTALMLASVLAFGSDALSGGALQMNGVFGHSPVVAGRFYGLDNPSATILYASAILGGAGLAEIRGHRRAPWWYGALLLVCVVLVGLPQLGANFGQLIAGVAGVTVAFTLARTGRIPWRVLVGTAVAVVAVAVTVALVDLARPAADRTHVGRFAAMVADGGVTALLVVFQRKIASAFGTLRLTEWTYVIPVALAVIGLLVYRPSGILREVIPTHPVLRGALGGMLIYGVVGFLVNDSGIAIPALVLAHAVPFLVLMGAEQIAPRGAKTPP